MLKQSIKIIPLTIIILIAILLLIQFIPIGKDHNNPPVVSEPKWDNPQTRNRAVRACFDCHSNETIQRFSKNLWSMTINDG